MPIPRQASLVLRIRVQALRPAQPKRGRSSMRKGSQHYGEAIIIGMLRGSPGLR